MTSSHITEDEFTQVMGSFADAVNIFIMACNENKKFNEFVTAAHNDIQGDNARGDPTHQFPPSNHNSLIFMVVNAFGAAWERLMKKVQEKCRATLPVEYTEEIKKANYKKIDNAIRSITDMYGLLLSSFMEDGTLVYQDDTKESLPLKAKLVSAIKLRKAIFPSCYKIVDKSALPWMIRFYVEDAGETHSFHINTSNLCLFFRIFIRLSKDYNITQEKIKCELKQMANDPECLYRDKLSFFKQM